MSISLHDEYYKEPTYVPQNKKGQGSWFCNKHGIITVPVFFLSPPYTTISSIDIEQLIQTEKVELGRKKQLILPRKPLKASGYINPALGERRKLYVVKFSEI